MKTVFLTGLVMVGGWGGSISVAPNAADSRDAATPLAATAPGSGSASPAGPGDAAGDASPIGIGPIDASGQPSEIVMNCPGAVGTVALSLPCQVGQSLTGAGPNEINVTECDLVSGLQFTTGHLPPISVMTPLGALPTLLNLPLRIPFDNVVAPPPGGYGELPGYPGEHFSGSIAGTAVFSQVDPVGRAFVGRLQQARFDWAGNQGDSFSCAVADGPFWAVPGDFR